MGTFLKVVAAAAKYGKRMTDWLWANKGRVLDWINAGQAIDWIIQQVKNILGIK